MTFGWHDVHIILLSMWSIAVWESANWLLNRRKKTLKWKCKRCDFKIKTDSPETYYISVTSHNHSSLKEFR